MRKQIRQTCGLDRFGTGYRYLWTIKRDGDTIQGIGAAPLYKEAQPGDDVTVLVYSRRSANLLVTEHTSL